MSLTPNNTKRLGRIEARKKIAEIVNRHSANIRFSRHCLEELKKDNLTTSNILNVIKSPAAKMLRDAEWEHGSFRYRLETKNITVIVAFDSLNSLVIVTAWRQK